VKNVLVLISSPVHPALNDGAIANAIDSLRAQDATVGTPDWLAPEIACDIPFEGPSTGLTMTALDGVVVAASSRRKKLDELADFLGLREKIAGITARAMNGEIDFAAALEERVGLLKGLPIVRLDEAAGRIRYTPGGATLVATMKQHGATCALVSGGFTYFTALARQALGFDLDAANTLKHDGRTLSGTVEPPILGKEAKLATLQRLATEHGLPLTDTLCVGDGANDLPMLKAAGLGVAFYAKPVVAAEVGARIDHGDLTSLLYLQGYRRSEFVERNDP
jgi:phosphoserine phosphatase